jgi:hypothetical protein
MMMRIEESSVERMAELKKVSVEEINEVYHISKGYADNKGWFRKFEYDLSEIEKKSKPNIRKVSIMDGRMRNGDGSYDYVANGKIFASGIYDED